MKETFSLFQHIIRLFFRDRFFLDLWLGNRKRISVSTFEKITADNGLDAVLIVLHSDYLEFFAGVESETLDIIRWISRKHRGDKQVLVYFYDFAHERYVLQCIRGGKMINAVEFEKDRKPEDIFQYILGSFSVRLCIIQHLQWHSLDYREELMERKIPMVLFVHDFFYYCPYPYLPASPEVRAKLPICDPSRPLSREDSIQFSKYFSEIEYEKWKEDSRKLFTGNFCRILFVSEFLKERYLELFDLSDSERYIVSYPNFFSKK